MEKKIVCYWGTWAAYRTGDAKFTFNNIDPTICTHIVYSFFGATDDGSVKFSDDCLDNQTEGGYINRFMDLKLKNINIKLMASVGGWKMEALLFSKIAADPAKRIRFAQSAAEFCDDHGFDGFDLNWLYNDEFHQKADKENYSLLVKELRSALGSKIFSIAASSSEESAKMLYNIADVAEVVDFVNISTYDLHGVWDGRTGVHAPLYAGPDENKQVNADACLKYWINNGCPRDKIILGIPTFGRSFTLKNPNKNGIGAPINGAGTAGLSGEAGHLGFNEICVNKWPRTFEEKQKSFYASKGDQWVGFDDVDSVKIKCEYINQKKLGGVMFWSLENDDFLGKGGQGKFPLIKTAHNTLK
ncbi:unnamed protein product [Diamesa tonsa]